MAAITASMVNDLRQKTGCGMMECKKALTEANGDVDEAIKLLREKAPWCKIVVGGAVLTEEYAASIGADKYASDAMETVRYAEEITAEK